MICPQTGSDCNATPCLEYGCCNVAGEKLKPSMAEVERLVDAFGMACTNFGTLETPEHQAEGVAARAALLAAIRPYVEGK